ncbi:hypothetical protein P4M26_03715 [Pseudomonas aeruginosa]|nr:hypothetical protein [Pseudomonas aeruginosa]
MKLNHVLQTAGYSMVVHPDGSIDVDGKRFVYEGANRKKKVYKLRLLGEDRQWELPILSQSKQPALPAPWTEDTSPEFQRGDSPLL